MLRFVSCLALLLLLSGCAELLGPPRHYQHAGSAVDYLYPDATSAPQLQPEVTRLHPPVRVGIAFAPGSGDAVLAEPQKIALLERVKGAFVQYPYIGTIQIIPSTYLRARGGFNNLEQVARMFDVEVVALVSYDQVQFNDTNGLAVLYWTIVGAYVVHGDKYDVQTLLDISVVDVASRKLLFRAPGTSEVKGAASMAGFSAHSREAAGVGFSQAADRMIPALQAELEQFKQRIKSDAAFKVENRTGYSGAGDIGLFGVLGALMLLAVLNAARRSR